MAPAVLVGFTDFQHQEFVQLYWYLAFYKMFSALFYNASFCFMSVIIQNIFLRGISYCMFIIFMSNLIFICINIFAIAKVDL